MIAVGCGGGVIASFSVFVSIAFTFVSVAIPFLFLVTAGAFI